ncbi:MAG: hypothetical protein IJ400_02560 [Clostridia bacterium]|nr:hypothetical protein [Clostridia bacterium]
MSIKIKDLTLGKGITNESGDMNRLAQATNLIFENGALRRRGGFFSPLIFQDESFEPKRINGLFGFGDKILVHAGTELFACNKDLTSYEKLNVALSDNKTTGFVADSMLYIVGGGELYVYTGSEVLPIKELSSIYVPTTRKKVYDQYGKDQFEPEESVNLLTPKRTNLLIGTTSYRYNEQRPAYKLDGRILEGSAMEIEVRIRLNATGLPEEPFVSNLIGVGPDGLETQEIVTIKYKIDSIYSEVICFPSEPIVDTYGNIINIRNSDGEPVEYNKIPLGVSIKWDKISFSYDIPTYEEGVSNIKITYETPNEVSTSQINNCTLCPRDTGSRAIAFSVGDNRLFYSDVVKNNDYVPRANVVAVGTGGEKITSLLEMSNGVLGVFTDVGFYKVSLFSDGRSNQVLNSADKIGSVSQLVNTTIAGDTLTFAQGGVYGTHSSSPYMDQIGYFYNRGKRISHILEELSQTDRENAVATGHEGKYFLFVGNKALIADTNQRFTREGSPSGSYEYEWYEWQGAEARYALSYGGTLYIGKENGRVGYLTKDSYDKDQTEYSQEKLTLYLSPQPLHTGITIDTGSRYSSGNRAILSSHERLASKNVTYKNGEYILPETDFYTYDQGQAIYEGQQAIIYDYGERVVASGKIGEVTPEQFSFKMDQAPTQEAVFPLSLYFVRDKYEYDFRRCGYHYCLSENGMDVRVKAENPVLWVIERKPIEAYLKTTPIELGNALSNQSLYGAFLKLTEDTRGKVEYQWESDKHKGSVSLSLYGQMDFNRLDFSHFCLYDSTRRDYYVPTLERKVRYVSLGLKTSDPYPFGIMGIGLKIFEFED